MPLDIYSTRTQLKAIELMPPVYSFLHDVFCADGGQSETDKAIYDYRKGLRQMAPIVHKGTGGVLMERGGYETREFGFCQIAPERLIDPETLEPRMFGENILGALSPEERSKKTAAKDLMEMLMATQRRREWMSRQVLTTGKLSVFRYTNEGRDLETTLMADFGFTQKYTPDTVWSDSSAKIDDDMKEIFDTVQEGCGMVDTIVMAPDVANAMQANTTYIKKYDMINAEMGKLMSRYVGQGVRFLGWNTDGAEIYSISGKFVDDDRKIKPILPSGMLIAGSKGMLKIQHGPVTQVESTGMDAAHKTYFKKEVPLRYGSIDGNSIKNRLTSCPTVMPENVDGWVVANVL